MTPATDIDTTFRLYIFNSHVEVNMKLCPMTSHICELLESSLELQTAIPHGTYLNLLLSKRRHSIVVINLL